MPKLKENRESWVDLQKGQAAELAFERIALAAGFGVQYNGWQYHEMIPPSWHREKYPKETPGKPDFLLYALDGKKWKEFAEVEVKWSAQKTSGFNIPATANYLVVFSFAGISASKIEDKKYSLKPIDDTEIGIERKHYAEIHPGVVRFIESLTAK